MRELPIHLLTCMLLVTPPGIILFMCKLTDGAIEGPGEVYDTFYDLVDYCLS